MSKYAECEKLDAQEQAALNAVKAQILSFTYTTSLPIVSLDTRTFDRPENTDAVLRDALRWTVGRWMQITGDDASAFLQAAKSVGIKDELKTFHAKHRVYRAPKAEGIAGMERVEVLKALFETYSDALVQQGHCLKLQVRTVQKMGNGDILLRLKPVMKWGLVGRIDEGGSESE